ncbi:MAG: hypothetical protein FJY92_12465 [Candidatus Hydrogenedentes bacterium]|nr:hypothetical protein [Candidatus Hydrogenedentota bacterium]
MVPIASPEDSLISKLLWYAMGSDRSWDDALRIARRQRGMRMELLRDLAARHNLASELDRLLKEATVR